MVYIMTAPIIDLAIKLENTQLEDLKLAVIFLSGQKKANYLSPYFTSLYSDGNFIRHY